MNYSSTLKVVSPADFPTYDPTKANNDENYDYMFKLKYNLPITRIEFNQLYENLKKLIWKQVGNTYCYNSFSSSKDVYYAVWQKILSKIDKWNETKCNSVSTWIYHVSKNHIGSIKHFNELRVKTLNETQVEIKNNDVVYGHNPKYNHSKQKVENIFNYVNDALQLHYLELLLYPPQKLLDKYNVNKKHVRKRLTRNEIKQELKLTFSEYNKLLTSIKPIVMGVLNEII